MKRYENKATFLYSKLCLFRNNNKTSLYAVCFNKKAHKNYDWFK